MYDYCLLACGTWAILCDNMLLEYATSEQEAKETAEKYNKEG